MCSNSNGSQASGSSELKTPSQVSSAPNPRPEVSMAKARGSGNAPHNNNNTKSTSRQTGKTSQTKSSPCEGFKSTDGHPPTANRGAISVRGAGSDAGPDRAGIGQALSNHPNFGGGCEGTLDERTGELVIINRCPDNAIIKNDPAVTSKRPQSRSVTKNPKRKVSSNKSDTEVYLSTSTGDLIIDRKRRLIGDEFYSRNGGILNPITQEDIQHLPTIVSSEDHLSPTDEILCSSGVPSNGVTINGGVPFALVEEEGVDLLKRIDPQDLGISVDSHGSGTVVVTSLPGGSLMQDVILYTGNPALLLNGLQSHSMPPASSSPTDSNSSNGSDLSASPPLGSSGGSFGGGKFSGGGGITLYGSPLSSLGLPHQHHLHHQFSHHGDYGNINQLSGATVITDMASILPQNVKNEPEDLTGARRDNHNNNDPTDDLQSSMSNSQNLLKSPLDSKSGSPPVVVTTDGHVVLSTDLNNSTFVPVGPPHGVSNDHPPYGNDFPGPPFDSSGRSIYPGDSYRTVDSDMYNPAPSPDFASTVQRVVNGDVQFVQYHYKGGSGPPLGPSIPQGPPGHGPNPHMNSPDSGIGDAALNQGHSDGFDGYPHAEILNDSYRKWNTDFRAPTEEKIQIPKVFSPYGFKYTMESPTSGSVRREDDRITYINKGQFYGLTLEYIMDPESPPLKSNTVKSVIMLVFSFISREGKSPDDELKAWQFWHGRQHSIKQRILDPDQKNSSGIVGGVEETLALNALVVYWNPLEGPAKVNIAVQCLSTDFSTQKGVKGLPLHLQIDTYDDPRDSNAPVYHRGYAQIKVFCDKGAERKARDEERRASKRRATPSGKRRLDEMYHTPLERSEFYSMADLSKPPVLFSPPDPDKAGLEFGGDIPSFYSRASPPDSMLKLNGSVPPTPGPDQVHSPFSSRSHYSTTDSKLLRWDDNELEQHHLFESRPIHLDGDLAAIDISIKKEHHILPSSLSGGPLPEKRPKLLPSPHERIMIYVRQETEEAYTPLHLVPPSVPGLIRAIESKYKINARNIRYLYRKNKQGALVKLDDDMIKYYCNEDVFLMQVMVTEGLGGEESMVYDITLSEI